MYLAASAVVIHGEAPFRCSRWASAAARASRSERETGVSGGCAIRSSFVPPSFAATRGGRPSGAKGRSAPGVARRQDRKPWWRHIARAGADPPGSSGQARPAPGERPAELLGRAEERADEPDREQAERHLEAEADQHRGLERRQPTDLVVLQQPLEVLLHQESDGRDRRESPAGK